eukprot:gnl/TRDRNA2_/TRDRNA2_139771_c1_seq1.p1 gnl/TRDRNA2_/TRDRNA2_139771_c1~~gnl/TRDRNA2_/TRDRNA2_139771_c1_seq1.p1  ORF type:complete len:170 (-),score=27.10 gnl/TRDRNA2_/TRDRNA2_139771_c1_seq1:111-590(-)
MFGDHLREGGPELVQRGTTWFGLYYSFASGMWDFIDAITLDHRLGSALGPGNVLPYLSMDDKEAHRAAFEGYHDWIRSLVPKDRLLEFDVKKHGWQELCEFLGYPVPPTKFPHSQVTNLGWKVIGILIHLANFWIAKAILMLFCLSDWCGSKRLKVKPW